MNGGRERATVRMNTGPCTFSSSTRRRWLVKSDPFFSMSKSSRVTSRSRRSAATNYHIRKQIFHKCPCVLHIPVECWAAWKIFVTVRLTCFNCSI